MKLCLSIRLVGYQGEGADIRETTSNGGRRSADATRIVVLGGGLSGASTAWALARAGCRNVAIVERATQLGGLAGSFEVEGHSYPLGYHHILDRDRTLRRFLEAIGATSRIRWRRIRMLFETESGVFDLARPLDFLRFPLGASDKMRFARLMLRAFRKHDWSDWLGRSARELVDAWGSPAVRRALFEPLTRLKFDLPCDEVSAAWLGARLHFREGSSPLGYIPDVNWTKVLCDGVTDLVREAGVQVRSGTSVTRLEVERGRVAAAVLDFGERLEADIFVSTVPPETLRTWLPDERTPSLSSIRYTALISLVCSSRQALPRDFYWLNLGSLRHAACGLFVLTSLNPSLGPAGETCLNFVSHLASTADPRFSLTDAELLAAYARDFRSLFALSLEPRWYRVNRIRMYSPVFDRSYENPPPRSATFANLYLAGNYRTFPSVASTGTALGSGLETASVILRDEFGRAVGPDVALMTT